VILIIQKCLPAYRKKIFDELLVRGKNVHIAYSDPDVGKLKSVHVDTSSKNYTLLSLKKLRLFKRTFYIQTGLLKLFRNHKIDTILVEGESNFISSILCLLYSLFSRKTKVIVWTLGYLPNRHYSFISILIKYMYYNFFDGVMFYSKYSFDFHNRYFINNKKYFYNTNITMHKQCSNLSMFRKKRDVNNIVGFYVGAWGGEKNTDFFLNPSNYTGLQHLFVFSKNVPECDASILNKLENVTLISNYTYREIYRFAYRCCDFMILPGRGGQVVGEALLNGLPVICWSGDGTEHELISHKNGMILESILGISQALSTPSSIFNILNTFRASDSDVINDIKRIQENWFITFENRVL